MAEYKPATCFRCPRCEAKMGWPCVTPKGKETRTPHRARLLLVERKHDEDRHAETITLLANR